MQVFLHNEQPPPVKYLFFNWAKSFFKKTQAFCFDLQSCSLLVIHTMCLQQRWHIGKAYPEPRVPLEHTAPVAEPAIVALTPYMSVPCLELSDSSLR